MASPQLVSVSTLAGLVSLKSAYSLAFSFLFGTAVWVTFFGGIIAFRALPRQMFGTLQHRTFPVYFNVTVLVASGLLAAWTYTHDNVIVHVANPLVPDVLQAYTLAVVILSQGLNSFVIGPLTSKTMFKRQRLEKEEGKAYSDPGVSDAMKALNRTFMQLHGWSSLANLTVVVALTFHGLWLGEHGLTSN